MQPSFPGGSVNEEQLPGTVGSLLLLPVPWCYCRRAEGQQGAPPTASQTTLPRAELVPAPQVSEHTAARIFLSVVIPHMN